MKEPTRFYRIYHKGRDQWLSHITGTEGHPVEWVTDMDEANTFAQSDLPRLFGELLVFENHRLLQVRSFRRVSASDHDPVMRQMKKTHALLQRMNNEDAKKISQLEESLRVETGRIEVMRAENARLHTEAKRLWEALAPFGKMMREGDRERLADPSWHGGILAQRGTASDMTVVGERDMAQAGVAWRECWFGLGDPPDDNGELAEPEGEKA